MKHILVIDGQGGKIGRALIEALLALEGAFEITAVGTNAMATAQMLKAGSVRGATGENAIRVGARRADIIVGPVGIVMADAMLGEITPAAAEAVAAADAVRVLLPMNRTPCDTIIAGVREQSMQELLAGAVDEIRRLL